MEPTLSGRLTNSGSVIVSFKPRIDFRDLQRECQSNGWELAACTQTHWQIRGALVKPVNLHWKAGGGLVAYVNGAVKGVGVKPKVSSIVSFCRDKKPLSSTKTTRKQMTKIRDAMLESSRSCKWCSKQLTSDTATVDHLIAISRGGSNRRDNLCLACEDCNRSRGNSCASGVRLERDRE